MKDTKNIKNTKDIKKDSRVHASGRGETIGERTLLFASFVCGTCVMVLEMAGSRIVAPHMGTSQIVWTSIIGIIMASLTAGYWAGGRVADRRPDPRLLARIVGGAAVWSLILSFAASPFLSMLVRSVSSIYAASALASICLFAVPSILLGMVSPFIVRLAMHELGSAGSTVGKCSAVSSAGSILGTFLGGFVLILFFSSRTMLVFVAVALAAVSLILTRGRSAISLVIIAAAAGLGIYIEAGEGQMLTDGKDIETRYNTVRVMDTKVWLTQRDVRILQTDPMGAQSLMYIDSPSELYSDYTKFYDLAFHYRPETKRVLMLGGGGYCVPRHITATRPDVAVDVVELDPGITQIARDYFHLEDRPGQRIFHEDARMFVERGARTGEKYDAIFEDVFGSSYSIPFHLTTTECMGSIFEMLEDGGVLVINIISEISGELFAGIWSSVADHFESVMIFPATYPNSAAVRQNIMLVAIKGSVRESDPESEQMGALLAHKWTAEYTPKIASFRDEFAPVERYSLPR